ncbi:MAG: tyrosine--tRNA ligase, partial [Candidatus Eremiobacterota bacterium]
TSPYEFYQYWRNVEDVEVGKLLKTLTFFTAEKIEELSGLTGKDINTAKKELAYAITELVHGKEEAEKARAAAEALFEGGGESSSIPVTDISGDKIKEGIQVLDALLLCGLISSKGEGRRLIGQSGIHVNDNVVTDQTMLLNDSYVQDGKIKFRKGKKVYHFLRVIQ